MHNFDGQKLTQKKEVGNFELHRWRCKNSCFVSRGWGWGWRGMLDGNTRRENRHLQLWEKADDTLAETVGWGEVGLESAGAEWYRERERVSGMLRELGVAAAPATGFPPGGQSWGLPGGSPCRRHARPSVSPPAWPRPRPGPAGSGSPGPSAPLWPRRRWFSPARGEGEGVQWKCGNVYVITTIYILYMYVCVYIYLYLYLSIYIYTYIVMMIIIII